MLPRRDKEVIGGKKPNLNGKWRGTCCCSNSKNKRRGRVGVMGKERERENCLV